MILSYSLIASLILSSCYLVYRIFLAGKRQHAFNRTMLLLIYAISLTLPIAVLAEILNTTPHSISQFALGLLDQESGDATSKFFESSADNQAGFLSAVKTLKYLYIGYILGVIFTMLYYVFGLVMLWRLMKKGERIEFGNFSLILINDSNRITPFSWHNSIVMRRSEYEEDGNMIIIHEFAHLKLLHWVDLVLAYLTVCLQWYNPVAWAMRGELKSIHEYQADEYVIESGIDPKEYLKLLVKRAAGFSNQSFTSSLRHGNLKKRVAMVYSKRTSMNSRLVALALVPAIGVGIAITSIPDVAGALRSIAEIFESNPSDAIASASVDTKEERQVYIAVENQAEFPGGMEVFGKWLNSHLAYPEEAEKDSIQGRVIIRFVIEADGTVTHPEILRGLSPAVDKEAIRLVNSMPKWTPGKINGKEVASYFTIPIVFRISD